MIKENEATTEMIKEKLEFYLNNKIVSHIRLKNKRFLNAIIIGKSDENVYEIKEKKFGLMHLFVSDIVSLEDYIPVEDG